MASRVDLKDVRSISNDVWLHGVVTLGASGAVASQVCNGFTVAKTGSETGRYTVTFVDGWVGLHNHIVGVAGTADANPVNGKGVVGQVRNVNMSTKSLHVQMLHASGTAFVDAEAEDGAVLRLSFCMDLGKC